MSREIYERNRVVKRQWLILKFLASNRYATLELIADQFGRSQRTIRRDISVLEEVGFPIRLVANADGAAFVRLDRNWLDLHSHAAGFSAANRQHS